MPNLIGSVAMPRRHGLGANRGQCALLVLQMVFAGLMLGMERTVMPSVSQTFGVAPQAFLFLASFVLSFGLVKGPINLLAGGLADRFGRKPILVSGWIAAIPIPILIYVAPNWWWIVLANVFLGVSQGFTWTMAVTCQIDLAGRHQRGLAVGINEATGTGAIGLAGLIAAVLSHEIGARAALLGLGLVTIAVATATLSGVSETLPWVHAEHAGRRSDGSTDHALSFAAIFTRISFRDPVARAICQGGIANKIADTSVWVMFPRFFHAHGAGLVEIGWLTGTYAVTWGVAQLWTGHLGDRIGRRTPVVAGFLLLAGGIVLTGLGQGAALWLPAAGIMGGGMALLYPNLIAALSDEAGPLIRGKALGTYRYWRDTGYAIGALLLGAVAQIAHTPLAALWLAAVLVAGSGIWLIRSLPGDHAGSGRFR